MGKVPFKPPKLNMLRDAIVGAVDDLTVDDLLRSLIADTDLIEVACCLDMIAREKGREVQVWHGPQREYPLQKMGARDIEEVNP